GTHDAGADHAHADAQRLELRRETLRQGDHRELAGRVWAEAEPADHSGHRGGVDEMTAFAMGADVRQECADAVDHAHQVDVEHPAPGVERAVVNATAAAGTCLLTAHVVMPEGR